MFKNLVHTIKKRKKIQLLGKYELRNTLVNMCFWSAEVLKNSLYSEENE